MWIYYFAKPSTACIPGTNQPTSMRFPAKCPIQQSRKLKLLYAQLLTHFARLHHEFYNTESTSQKHR